MTSDEERCAEYERFKKIHAAFKAGDLEALREAVEDPDAMPNGPMPLAIGPCLEYAIYHSPLRFVRALLEIGANPNPKDHSGFPPLIAALSCSRSQPGSPARPDVADILRLLLSFGADPNQRGINDYTAMHMAVAERNAEAIDILLEAGADPRLRTRIDECETPREMAEGARLSEIAARLGRRGSARSMSYTEADFERLSWHDCHIWGVELRPGDPDEGDWTSDLALDIDFITEWICGVDGGGRFRVAPATLVFHGVTDPKIAIDWGRSGYQVALHPVSIATIEREVIPEQKVHLDRPYYRWRIALNWPDESEITFGAVGFTQTLRAEPILSEAQCLSLRTRSRLTNRAG